MAPQPATIQPWIIHVNNPWFSQDLFEVVSDPQSKASTSLSTAALACMVQLYSYGSVWNYSKFLNGCQFSSACPWRVGTCQWRVDGDRRLSYWLDLLGAIRKIERRLNCVNVPSAFSQWEKRRNPSSTWNYVSTRRQQNTLQLPTIKKFHGSQSPVYSKFLNGCQSGSACPWRVGTCRWRVDEDRRLSYWLDLLGAIRKIEGRLNCVNVRSAFSQWERRWNPSSTWNYVSTRKQQNTLQLTTIKKFAVPPNILSASATSRITWSDWPDFHFRALFGWTKKYVTPVFHDQNKVPRK